MKLTESLRAAALKKFARGLLTTTCLTAAAAGMAQAGVVNESSVAGADFGNTFGLRNNLGAGVTEVIGAAPNGDVDFFSISGLLGGGAFSISGIYTGFANYSVLNSAQGTVSAGGGNLSPLTGTIPNDGILVVQVSGSEGPTTYDLTLSAPTSGVPEPSTLGGVGLALAAGYALRRKLAK
jgi:PEP-CTERM motif